MNVLVVDTSSWISYFKGRAHDDLDLALKEGRVYVSPIVVAELLSGKMKNDTRNQLISLLSELPMCEHDLNHWVHVGKLRHDLLINGISISTPDAHIAQCTLDLDGYLLTEDRIFEKIAKKLRLKML